MWHKVSIVSLLEKIDRIYEKTWLYFQNKMTKYDVFQTITSARLYI